MTAFVTVVMTSSWHSSSAEGLSSAAGAESPLPEDEVGPSSISSIYILRVGPPNGSYKVGRTSRAIGQRVRQLQTGSSAPLTVVKCFTAPADLVAKLEAFVHASLWDLASGGSGGGKEFFTCDEETCLVERVRDACADFLAFHQRFLQSIEALSLFRQRRELAAAARLLDLKKELLEQALKERFPEGCAAESMEFPPLLLWKKRTFSHFDLEAFKLAHPELAKQFYTTRVSRIAQFW